MRQETDEPHLHCVVYFDRAVSACCVVAVRTMTAHEELDQVLRLLKRANELVLKLPSDGDQKTVEVATKLRWVIRRLSKRAWILATEIQPTT